MANMSFNSSSTSSVLDCNNYNDYIYINITINTLRIILLLPLSTIVLYLGHRQWRQQCSFKTASHSDIFTYHMAAIELIWIVGGFFVLGSIYTQNSELTNLGLNAYYMTFYGRIIFHILTCVECYLAVVHPITYMSLRNARGVKIRNISIGCAWLLCFGLSCGSLVMHNGIAIQLLCVLILSITTLSFCSLAVLHVLIHPGPGDTGGGKKRADQSKQRAFYTITVISSVLWLWCIGLLASVTVTNIPVISNTVKCLVLISVEGLNLPSCLVLPLLYLHRAGKFTCCFSFRKLLMNCS